jgi:NAD(P)-dependent dehydrogenase (short-subunit alcohol dehydrogenase family)
MRSRKTGTIINISSISGRLAQPGSGYYSAPKFALEGMSDALRKELKPLGIQVMVVEPGAFRTSFAGRSLQGTKHVIEGYQDTVGPRRKGNDRSDGTQQGDPAKAARIIIDLVESKDMPFRLILGSDALNIARTELNAQIEELEAWKALSITTSFDTAG